MCTKIEMLCSNIILFLIDVYLKVVRSLVEIDLPKTGA